MSAGAPSCSWMKQLTGASRQGHHGRVLHLFFTRLQSGDSGAVDSHPAAVPTALRACARLGNASSGRLIHALVITQFPSLASDAVAATALLDMYAKCGLVASARRVFDEMPRSDDLVAWNALLAGYARHGLPERALALAIKMRGQGLRPDLVTWNAVVSGFALAGDDEMAEDMVRAMQDDGFWPDVVTWTSLVSGSVLNFHYDRARALFRRMVAAGTRILPSSATIASILPAFANVADVKRGKEVHAYAIVTGVEQDLTVSSALVDMYAKCGLVLEAYRVFDKMAERSTVTWNSMIFGLANSGHCQEAIDLFDRMLCDGARPDHLTFTAVLTACSYCGMVEVGKGLYRAMKEHGIQPRLEHYACMVHLLGRAGKLAEAYDFIKAMPLEPDCFVWGALLGACRSHGNVKLAELAAARLRTVEPANAANCLLFSDALASAGRHDDVLKMKRLAKRRRMEKLDGCSWLESA
ncbi:unnamed protein product [Urochloa humidicola]